MRSVILISAFIVIVTCCSLANAKPFINLFNVAVKTDFAEDGNVVSFVYPKNKYSLQLKFNRESINEHSFNIGGLFQSVIRHFRKRVGALNPFRFFTTTTTTEAPLDFSDEDGDDDSTSTSDGGSDSSSNALDDDKDSGSIGSDGDDESSSDGDDSSSSSSSGNEESIKEDSNTTGGGVASNGYKYPNRAGTSVTVESAAVSYLPPSTPRDTYLPSN